MYLICFLFKLFLMAWASEINSHHTCTRWNVALANSRLWGQASPAMFWRPPHLYLRQDWLNSLSPGKLLTANAAMLSPYKLLYKQTSPDAWLLRVPEPCVMRPGNHKKKKRGGGGGSCFVSNQITHRINLDFFFSLQNSQMFWEL